MARRFQFGLRNLLWAVFWLCLSGASFSTLKMLLHDRSLPPREPPLLYVLYGVYFWSLIFMMFWSPIVAIGAFVGRTKRAMLIGAVVVPLLVIVSLMALMPTVQ